MEHFAYFKKTMVHLYGMTWNELQELFVVQFQKQTTETVILYTQKYYIYIKIHYTFIYYIP